MKDKITIRDLIRKKKKKNKITMLTAYDYPTARIVDEAGIDVVLVGDSLANVMLGYSSTIPVTMDEMLHHLKAVRRGVKRALLVGDMPFMSFHVSIEDTMKNAGRFMKEGGAEAVKLEGGEEKTETISRLVSNGIPVMGHIGLTPQSVHQMGGYRVQGKTLPSVKKLLNDARSIAQAGVFSIVLEGIPWPVAEKITQIVDVPTIGIGAGPRCDGQVLVLHDMLGILFDPPAKFVKQFAQLHSIMNEAVKSYIHDVKNERFPQIEHSYELPEKLINALNKDKINDENNS